MKAYADTLVRDVEITMDEIAVNDAEMEGLQDDQERSTIITSKIPEAIRFVLANADWSLLSPDEVITGLVPTESATSLPLGRIPVPDDFLRLVYAKYNSWSRFLGHNDLIMWDDPAYAKLKDPYCTGTPDRPKIALAYCSVDGQMEKVFELYTPKDRSDMLSIGIMKEPAVKTEKSTGNKYYNIPDKVYRAIVYYIAGLVWVTYGEQQRAQMMFTEANDIIGFSQMGSQNVAPTVVQ